MTITDTPTRPAETAATAPSRASVKPTGPSFAYRYGLLGVLLVVIAAFAIVAPATFPTWDNARLVLANLAIPGILALAAILALTVGEFDLSLGATLGFSAISAVSLSNAGLPLPIVLIATLAIGAAVGGFNALLVVVFRVNAFIATLGAATLLAGSNLLLTNGSLLTLESSEFGAMAITRIGGLQVVVAYFIVVALLLWFVMEKTPFGRYARATGFGRPAAKLSGVSTHRYLVIAFVLGGVLAALAGFLQAARAGSTPPSLGPDFLLPAYAAAFLGATAIRPGYFNVWGTVISVVLLAVGTNGLTLLGAATWVTNYFNGAALILSVVISGLLARRRGKAPVR